MLGKSLQHDQPPESLLSPGPMGGCNTCWQGDAGANWDRMAMRQGQLAAVNAIGFQGVLRVRSRERVAKTVPPRVADNNEYMHFSEQD